MRKEKFKQKKDMFFKFFKQHKKIRLCTLVMGSCLGLFLLINFGRYVKEIIENHLSRTQEFYFNSDKLTEDMKHFEINFWSGVDNYEVNIGMNSLDNDLKGTDIPINYNISCEASEGASCELSKEYGTIGTATNRDSFIVTVVPEKQFQVGESVEITVKAKASDPFEKEIGAVFKFVVGYYDLSYQIDDQVSQPYLNVLLTNANENYTVKEAFLSYGVGDNISISEYNNLTPENKKKCVGKVVTLKFDPNILRMDMTNSNFLNNIDYTTVEIDGFKYVDSLTFNVNAEASTIVKFYKLNVLEDYTYPFVISSPIVKVEVLD